MDIRRLDAAEHGRTRPLYEEIFTEDSAGFVDYYYTEKTKDNHIYVVEEDGEIQSMLHLNPYELSVNGHREDSNYIVAVATREQYRRRGYMGELIKTALRDMYEKGQCFTFLMPAAESIYTPYGFRTVYEQSRRRCPVGEPEEKRLENGRLRQIFPAEEAALPELAQAANEALAARYQVYALRSAEYYRRRMKELAGDGGTLMVYREDGSITDCRPYFPEEDPERAAGKDKPKIMARIVDVRRMLASVRLRSLTAVCFRITDDIIEGNNRCVAITGSEHSGILLADGAEENSEGTLPVAALANLLFGAKPAEDIRREEGVEMTERMKGELEKLIPLSAICLNEEV